MDGEAREDRDVVAAARSLLATFGCEADGESRARFGAE